jgi:hypothetical protein
MGEKQNTGVRSKIRCVAGRRMEPGHGRAQFIPHEPPQHPPPPLSHDGADDAEVDPPLITAAAGTEISRWCAFEPQEAQTISSATSLLLW